MYEKIYIGKTNQEFNVDIDSLLLSKDIKSTLIKIANKDKNNELL